MRVREDFQPLEDVGNGYCEQEEEDGGLPDCRRHILALNGQCSFGLLHAGNHGRSGPGF
jgi:hypothetical protein